MYAMSLNWWVAPTSPRTLHTHRQALGCMIEGDIGIWQSAFTHSADNRFGHIFFNISTAITFFICFSWSPDIIQIGWRYIMKHCGTCHYQEMHIQTLQDRSIVLNVKMLSYQIGRLFFFSSYWRSHDMSNYLYGIRPVYMYIYGMTLD